MIVLHLFFGALCFLPFFIVGLLFVVGKGEKGEFWLAGWNTLSPEKRARINKKAMFSFMGWLFIALALLTAAVFAAMILEHELLTLIGWIVWTVVLTAGLIYANTSKRFKNKEDKT